MKVFIVGSQRSGTSAMLTALRQATGWPADVEGHAWPLVTALGRVIGEMQHLTQSDVDDLSGFSIHRLRPMPLMDALARALGEQMNRLFNSTTWIDKTPGLEMVKCCRSIARVMDDARFVFMKRHPVACIKSMMRRFPHGGLRRQADHWRLTNAEWLAARDHLKGRYVEVGQEEMLSDPAGVAARIAQLLQLDTAQTRAMAEALQSQFPEQTRAVTAPPQQSLADLTQDTDDRLYFFERCSGVAERLGYMIRQAPDSSGGSNNTFNGSRRVFLFYPASANSEDALVRNGNPYSYRRGINEFQLCVNPPEQGVLELQYRNLALHGHTRVMGRLQREFINAPALVLQMSVEEAGTGRQLASRAWKVEAMGEVDMALDFAPVPQVNVRMSLSLSEGETSARYGTVLVRDLCLAPPPEEGNGR